MSVQKLLDDGCISIKSRANQKRKQPIKHEGLLRTYPSTARVQIVRLNLFLNFIDSRYRVTNRNLHRHVLSLYKRFVQFTVILTHRGIPVFWFFFLWRQNSHFGRLTYDVSDVIGESSNKIVCVCTRTIQDLNENKHGRVKMNRHRLLWRLRYFLMIFTRRCTSLSNTAVFNWVTKAIRDCTGFVFLRFLIGPGNSRHSVKNSDQSDAKLKPIST